MSVRSVESRKIHEIRRRRFGRSHGTLEKTALVALVALVALGAAWSLAYGKNRKEEKPKEAQFRYVGGTEDVPAGCDGRLEVGQEALTFKCFQYNLAIPYASINLMQYRPEVSKEVWKRKPKWKVRPAGGGGKQNRYFTVGYTKGGATHVVVLDVPPDAMRPYLAEIDLKAGRRVEVKGYEESD